MKQNFKHYQGIYVHFPHKFSNIIFKYLKHKKIVNILKQIISPNKTEIMLFVKAPGKLNLGIKMNIIYLLVIVP